MQNFIQKKKTKTQNKTKKQRKDKSRKRQKVGHEREKDNFVQHTLPPFLPILERLNYGGPREKMVGPHHFSLPLPLSSKHPSHPFSPIFHSFFSILPKIHPSKHSVNDQKIRRMTCFLWKQVAFHHMASTPNNCFEKFFGSKQVLIRYSRNMTTWCSLLHIHCESY